MGRPSAPWSCSEACPPASAEVYDRLAAAGLEVNPDRDQAWRDFVGWRVNYDVVLVTLCAMVMAPYAPWSSDRSMAPFRVRVLRRARPRSAGPPD